MTHRPTPLSTPLGFTLIEALIALLVLSVGLAGLGGLIMVGIKANDSAMMRNQAIALAYGMADRMRANRGTTGATGTALGGGYTAGGSSLAYCNGLLASDSRSCASQPATTSGTAQSVVDLAEWWQSIDRSGLPAWYARIERIAGTTSTVANRFVIAVQWDDSRAKSDDEVAATGVKPACYNDTDTTDQIPVQVEQVCITTQL